jgi:hypothetical protein
MDNKSGFQISSRGDDGITGFASAPGSNNPSAILQNGRTACAVDGTIHPTATHQRSIGRINDGVRFYLSYITFYEFYFSVVVHLSVLIF